MQPGTIRTWSFIHKWTSILCTAFLLILCVTGMPLIFAKEINGWLYQQPRQAAVTGTGPGFSLDDIIQRAHRVRQGDVPVSLSQDTDGRIVRVTTAPTPDAQPRAMHYLVFDRMTGALLPAPPHGGVIDVVREVHTNLFLGVPGRLLLGTMGLLFLIAVVSGVVLYVPFMARLPFGTVRRDRSTRLRWTDIHNLAGIALLMWMSVVGMTGTLNALADQVTGYWRANSLADIGRGAPVRAGTGSVDGAVRLARATRPDLQIAFVAFPGTSYSTAHHLAVFMHDASAAHTVPFLTPVFVDAQSGALAAVRPMPWYLQMLMLARPLHYGDFGGLPVKLLWGGLDLLLIVVLGSGLYLWLSGRKRPARKARA